MVQRHAALPWAVEEVGVSSAGPDGEAVCEIIAGGQVRVAEHLSEADAAFIVRAVNSHEQLVAALEAARDALNNTGRGDVFGAWEKANSALLAVGVRQ